MIPSSTPSRQKGTVLAIAMIMLVLLTIIGLAGMRGTMMEERMAANTKEQHRALHAAELALARGEGELEALYEGTALLQDLGALGACVTSNLATRVNIDDVLADLSLNWQAITVDEFTAEEVVPFHFHFYCGDTAGDTARARAYIDPDGNRFGGDDAPEAEFFNVHVYNVVGIGRVRIPAGEDPEVVLAESVVVSSYGVITDEPLP